MLKEPVRNRGIFGYFVTEAGRRLTFIAAGSVTLGLFAANFLPHTVGLKYYQDFVTCYQNGIPRPVAEKVRKRLEKAMDKLKLRPYEQRIIRPFSVFGFDLFHAGSTKYRFGGLLGIPINFSYSDPSEINRSEVRFRAEPIDWNSESGKLLQESIVLTEEEQMFGLCKSLLQLQTHGVLMNSIFPTVSFLTVYTVGHYLNRKLNLYARPLSLRFVMYGILGLFGLGTYTFMKDYNQVITDTDIDKQLCSLGPEFVEAGVSYYDKILKKNMALRALIGDDTYTAKGNENSFLRTKSLPLTIRKSYFEEKWKELQQSAETVAEMSN